MQKNTVHLLRTSPFDSHKAQLCIELLTAHDALVLIDDGCYLTNHPLLAQAISSTSALYIVNAHQQARALVINKTLTPIDLTQLNELFFTYKNSITW